MLSIFSCARCPYFLWRNVYSNLLHSFNQIIFLLSSNRNGRVAQLVKNPPAMRETWVRSLGGKIPWRRERLPTPLFWPGEFHGLCSPLGHKELDTTE